jgi:hypothetical protein
MRKNYFSVNILILLLLSALFLFAAIDKMSHYDRFVNALRNYVAVPAGWAPYLAPPIIIVELLIGLCLFHKKYRSRAALLAAGTLAVFTFGLVINHLYGSRGVCGCWFTITLAQGSRLHVAQNIGVAILALLLWKDSRSIATKSKESIQIPPSQL